MPEDLKTLFIFYICLHIFLAVIVNKIRQDEVTKRWAVFFGGGLVILAAQYAVMGYNAAKQQDLYSPFITLLSLLNNPFFLAGALILLDRTDQRDGWRHLLSGRFFLIFMAATVGIAACILASGAGDMPLALALSTAAVSMVVYAVEAYAYFTVLSFFRYNVLRFLPIATALFFSAYEMQVALKMQWGLHGYLPLLFRFLFFITPVLMLALRMPQDLELKKIFDKATGKREFINSERLVESIGILIKAQEVMFLIERPKFHLAAPEPLARRFDGYAWKKGRVADGSGYSLQAALENTTEAERDLLREVCPQDRAEGPRRYPYQYCRSAGGFETVILPIKLYGGIIGALFVRLQPRVKVRAIFIEKLKLVILTLLPLAQGSRQMAAIGMLSDGFTNNLFLDERAATGQGAGGKPEVLEGVDEILGAILETLCPLAVALKPSAHFNPEGKVLLRRDTKYFPDERCADIVTKYFGDKPDDNPLDGDGLGAEPLGGIRPFRMETAFGRLIMFVGKESDYPARPAMGIHPVVLDVLRAMTNSALKSILDYNLKSILEDADKELSEGATKTLDVHHIAHVLQKYARRFGIEWVVVVLDGSRFHGQEEKFELVRPRLRACAPDRTIHVEELTDGGKRIGQLVSANWPLESAARSNGHPASQISFWFGVENTDVRRDEAWENIFRQFIRLGVSKVKDLRMRYLLERWDAEQEFRMEELARFCQYVGNEARLITFGVRDEAGVSDKNIHFHRLMLLAEELSEAGDFLSRLGQEGAQASDRLVIRDVIQEAWDGLNAAGQKRGGTLLFEGDCRARVVAAKDEMLFLFSRLLHWLASSAEEGEAPARLTARCRLDGLQVEISLEGGGLRMHGLLRRSMFVPMTQRINYDQLQEGGGPLAMYLAKTILEKRYKGSLADRSDELPGEAGHRLVVTMPILN